MNKKEAITAQSAPFIVPGQHDQSDYFGAIRALVAGRTRAANEEKALWQEAIDAVYLLVSDEIRTRTSPPLNPVSFGTSGWRGILGKDLFVHSVSLVSSAILALYQEAESASELARALGVKNFAEMRRRGCVLGFDNRFGGPTLALAAANVLAANGVRIFYAGEATTGALSASVLIRGAAFSINLTPSHNPLEYGGFKFNAADAGPAAPVLTDTITRLAREFIRRGSAPFCPPGLDLARPLSELAGIFPENALASWRLLMRRGQEQHGLDYDALLAALHESEDIFLCVNAVHGASRNMIAALLQEPGPERLRMLQQEADPTFEGLAPEPSAANMQSVVELLNANDKPLKLGAIIDPDGDRIRFTDGRNDISMNQFGAMACHYLHTVKKKRGLIAKTLATSNLANAVAKGLGEEIFEPPVGFKEFKPVIGRALVCFEESDGITLKGHTPEKDAFIGLILALDMMLTLKKNLGAYLAEIEAQYGRYCPAKGSVTVRKKGDELLRALASLERYGVGSSIPVGDSRLRIKEVVALDGRKMIFVDDSWLMIRPSGTEPKVRFYVEARNLDGCALLLQAAKSLLAEIGLLP